jgi:hypothetical protein
MEADGNQVCLADAAILVGPPAAVKQGAAAATDREPTSAL